MNDSIKILSSQNIDKDKWNECVRKSENGFLFAHSRYLDCTAKHWDGLIIGNYDAILPLIWNKKFGIKYLYALPFVRQLGLIGNYNAALNIFEMLSKPYQYGDVLFNYKNSDIANQLFSAKKNYVLDLAPAYQMIHAAYKKSLKNKLQKTSSLKYVDADFNDAIDAYRMHIKEKYKDMPEDFEKIKSLCKTDFGRQYFHPYKVIDEDENILLYGIYGKDERRIYKFMTTHLSGGKEKYAMIFAVDFLIKKYAEQPLLFDFMGSELHGVKTFIENFSPEEQPYFLYHFNHLPKLVRAFKK